MNDPTTVLWEAPRRFPALKTGIPHVWAASLDVPPDLVAALKQTLSRDELMRLDRLVFERDRRRFIVARGGLRRLLARYLRRAPEGILLDQGGNGKPHLRDAALRFNVSHSREIALYAVAKDIEVGVDVEYLRADVEDSALARRFFSPSEQAALQAIDHAARRREAFFRCWARKEAFLKAVGYGLSFPLSDFEVTVGPDQSPRLLGIKGDAEAARAWRLYDLTPATGYVAALSTNGQGGRSACAPVCLGLRFSPP